MSYMAGSIEKKIFRLGQMILEAHSMYQSFNKFISKPHYIRVLDNEYIERYKKKYKCLYTLPRHFILFNNLVFSHWFCNRLKLMTMLVDLPNNIIQYIIDKERKAA